MHPREKIDKLQEEARLLLEKEDSLIVEKQGLETKADNCSGEIKEEATNLADKIKESSECEGDNLNIYFLKDMFHKKSEVICKKVVLLRGLREKIAKTDRALEQVKKEREEKKQLIENNGDVYLLPPQ